jgi:chitin disaccharide deacetylase
MDRLLIVNADDFGLSESVNLGIVQAHREGILTSASLMVRMPAANHAMERAGKLDLGLHVDLAEWVCRNGEWTTLYERVAIDDSNAVRAELQAQLEEFRRLTGKDPTHLDSHQHVHLQEPVRSLLSEMAAELAVPLRGITNHIRYCGDFYGQSGRGDPCPNAISVAAMIGLLRALPSGVTELACHPGGDGPLDSVYSLERALEVQVLCHPSVRQTITDEAIRLCSFADLAHASTGLYASCPQPVELDRP